MNTIFSQLLKINTCIVIIIIVKTTPFLEGRRQKMNLVEVLVCVLNDRKLKGRLRRALHSRIERFRETMIGKHLITGGPAERNDFDRIIVQFQSNLYKNCTNEQSIETLCRQFIGVLKEFSSDAALSLEESWRNSVAKEIPEMKSSFLCSVAVPLAGERPGLQHHHDDGRYGNGNPDCRSFVKVNGDASVSGSTSATNNPSSDVFLTEGSVTSDSLPPGTERLVPNTGFSPSLPSANSSPNRLPIEETLLNGPITMNPLISSSQRHHSFVDRRSKSEPHHASSNGREKDQARRSLSYEDGSQWSNVKPSGRRRGKRRQDSEQNGTRRKSKQNDSRFNSKRKGSQKDSSQQEQQKLVTRVETLERDLHQAEVKNLQQQVQSLTQKTESQSSTITSLTQRLNHQQRQSNINTSTNNYNGYDKTNRTEKVRKRYNNRKGSSQQFNTSQPSVQQSNTSQPSDSNKSRRWPTSIHVMIALLVVIALYISVRLSI